MEHHGHPQMTKELSFLGPKFYIPKKRIELVHFESGRFCQLGAGWMGSLGQLRLISSAETIGEKQFSEKECVVRQAPQTCLLNVYCFKESEICLKGGGLIAFVLWA